MTEHQLAKAAVVIGFWRDPANELTVILIERGKRGRHGGQISFPGGKLEEQDADLAACAIRETSEEIGVPVESVRILEALPPLTTLTTGFEVFPFIAKLDVPPDFTWRPQIEEVSFVIEARVVDLEAAEARGEKSFEFDGWETPRTLPIRRLKHHVIWGLTLKLLEQHLPSALIGRWDV